MATELQRIRETMMQLIEDNYSLKQQLLASDLAPQEDTRVRDQAIAQMLINNAEPQVISEDLLAYLYLKLEDDTVSTLQEMYQAEEERYKTLEQQHRRLEEELCETKASVMTKEQQCQLMEKMREQLEREKQELQAKLEAQNRRSPLQITYELEQYDPIVKGNNMLSPTYSAYYSANQFQTYKLGKTEKMEYSVHQSRFLMPEQQDLYTSGRLLENKVDFKYYYELLGISKNFINIMNKYPQLKAEAMFPNFLKSLKFGTNLAFAVFKDKATVVPIINENYAMHACVSSMQDNLVFTATSDLTDAILYVRYTKACKFVSFKGCEFSEIILEAPECSDEAVFVLNSHLRKVDVLQCKKLKRAICDVTNDKLLKHHVERQAHVKVGYKGGKGEWDDVTLQIVL